MLDKHQQIGEQGLATEGSGHPGHPTAPAEKGILAMPLITGGRTRLSTQLTASALDSNRPTLAPSSLEQWPHADLSPDQRRAEGDAATTPVAKPQKTGDCRLRAESARPANLSTGGRSFEWALARSAFRLAD